MSNLQNYEYECTKKCKCKQHGQEITSAITKRAIPNEKLAAFVARTCKNYAEITDALGRSALHVASSVGKYSLVEWLLNHGSHINAKDKESGSSALHRAIFYGCIDCAVLLMRYGANLDLTDNDYRVPLQHLCKFSDFLYKQTPACNELLVWGSNKNYNLAIGNEQGAIYPQCVDYFRKANIWLVSVAISVYHSLFLDRKGAVYSVGHGKGGRLGIGSENSLPSPKQVKIPVKSRDEKVICISCSKNHSLVLTNRSCVYACGSNNKHQLGIKSLAEKSTSFKEISVFAQYGTQGLQQVIARDEYSIAYSSKELFVWGANCGQFGANENTSDIIFPKLINVPDKGLDFVEANNYAIVGCTSGKQVFIYYNYKFKSLKSPTLETIKSISVCGGYDKKSSKCDTHSSLKFLILTETNSIFIWYDDVQKFLRCTLAHVRVLDIEKILLRNNQVMILSEGDVYLGKTVKLSAHNIVEDSSRSWYSFTYNKKDICFDQKIRIELKRVPNVDRVVDIFCDDDFESFAVLQENSRKYFTIPCIINEDTTFKKLLTETNETDSIHDLVFHVDNEMFYAHKYIIYTRSVGLMNIIEQYQDKNIYLNFKGFTGRMFELILKHIYTNYFLTNDDIDDIHRSLGPHCQLDKWNACALFLEFVQKFQLYDLAKQITSFIDGTGARGGSLVHPFNRVKRTTYSNLCDVTIKCANNQEIQAHKCVLVSRLEYFNMMFTNIWSENKIINLTTIPYEYMSPIIDFLYTADTEHFRKQNYSENFLYNMIVICDQFFINKLRRICEILVLEKISTRKCGEMLEFACAYNCPVLKRGCLDFIIQNLARVLTNKSLELCEPDVLQQINLYYRDTFREILDYRMITPDSSAISDDLLLSLVHDFNVDFDYRVSEDPSKMKNKQKGKITISKSAYSKRNYEKEAISSMKETSGLEVIVSSQKDVVNRQSAVEKDSNMICNEIEAESHSWTKVNEKKEGKRKSVITTALKTNNIIKEEEKLKGNFVNLNDLVKGISKTPTKVATSPSVKQEQGQTVSRQSFSLGDFTPVKCEKMSQKQRKRLSSESKTDVKLSPTAPINIPERQNVWSTSPHSTSHSVTESSFADIMKSPKSPPNPEIGSPNKVIKSPEKRKVSSPSATPSTSYAFITQSREPASFNEIVEEERRQKEYYERMRTKSLVLTQIEESAIAELREFYNVDNVYDEMITIERKSFPTTMNFAVWQRN